ncbi:MAG: DEAD/DEAH box helicase, partial [Petrotogales bacterium]
MNGNFYCDISNNILSEDEFYSDFNLLYSRRPDTIPEERLYRLYKRLLESAAIFACSSEYHQRIALNIVSQMIEKDSKNENIQAAIELILLRLGVFPGLYLSIKKRGYKDFMNLWNGGKIRKMPPALASEVLSKEILNRVEIEDEYTYLTDFQSQVLHSLGDNKNISISAPTSAGKSHVLKQYIIECMKNNEEFIAVYIVPTRALISQVQTDIRKALREVGLSGIDVYTSSFEVVGEGKKQYNRAVMVLTQERLQSIEGKCDRLDIDLMIVDEAQKVEGTDRGIVLEDSIQQIIEWNPHSQYIFLSPYTDNPEKIGKVFNCSNVEVIHSRFSPVNQNLFLVDKVENNLEVSLFNREVKKKIMTYQIHIRGKYPKAQYKRKAFVAVNVLTDGPTMIYCNKPLYCKKTAGYLSDFQDFQDSSQEVLDVISYLSHYIHRDYYLIDYLKRGVAYHYGSVPASVRRAIENLFEKKAINYVCCTSTLMEGVNFPAKNIILLNPRIDNKGMKVLDYLNIAGRAGRLKKDFNGSIYAIDIDTWAGFKPHIEDKEHTVTSAMETVISEKKDAIIQHLKDYANTRNNKDVEAAVTRFIIKEVKKGDIKSFEILFKD